MSKVFNTPVNLNGSNLSGVSTLTATTAAVGTGGITSSGTVSINSTTTSDVPLIIAYPQGAITLPVNTLTSTTSAGFAVTFTLASPATTAGLYVGQAISYSADNVSGTFANNNVATIDGINSTNNTITSSLITTRNSSGTGGTLSLTGTQSNLQEWQTSGGTVKASVDSFGNLSLNNLNASSINSYTASSYGLTSILQREEAVNATNTGTGNATNTTTGSINLGTTSNTGIFATTTGRLNTTSITVGSNKTYLFEIQLTIHVVNTANINPIYFGWVNGTGTITGQTQHAFARRFAGGTVNTSTNNSTTSVNVYGTYYNSSGSGVSTTSYGSGVGWNEFIFVIKGVLRTGTGGTVIPAITYGSTTWTLDESNLLIREVGADTLTTKGTWT